MTYFVTKSLHEEDAENGIDAASKSVNEDKSNGDEVATEFRQSFELLVEKDKEFVKKDRDEQECAARQLATGPMLAEPGVKLWSENQVERLVRVKKRRRTHREEQVQLNIGDEVPDCFKSESKMPKELFDKLLFEVMEQRAWTWTDPEFRKQKTLRSERHEWGLYKQKSALVPTASASENQMAHPQVAEVPPKTQDCSLTSSVQDKKTSENGAG